MADLNGVLQNTAQSQVNLDYPSGLDIIPLFLRAGELIPPYWSKARDYELSRFWMKEDHVSSALSMLASKFASIPVKVIPRDPSIKSHVKAAADLTANINSISDYGQGWTGSFAARWTMAFVTQDNGAFAEVIGDAPKIRDNTGKLRKDFSKPRVNFYGLAILDSLRCQRTSNPEFPIIYTDISGERYRFHHTRVMMSSSLPSWIADLRGVGFCALSRMIHTVQHLWDIATAEQEELGSRPKRRIIIGKSGITASEIASAFSQADLVMDNQGLRRYSKNVIIAAKDVKPSPANAIEIGVQDLHAALMGDDKERSITLGMFLIALALNIPPRWLWPATSTGATKADAMFQHVAGMGGGVGHLIMILKSLLGGDKLADVLGKPVPPYCEVVFDYQDDEQDRSQAEIRETRSKVYATNLTSGMTDIRTTRLQALNVGDITEQQFDDMELSDGRLPDGQDVLNLFYSTDPMMQGMLAISVGDILNPAANDNDFVLEMIADKEIELRATLASPERPKEFDIAKQAFAALIALKALYEGTKITGQTQIASEDISGGDVETEQGDPKPDVTIV